MATAQELLSSIAGPEEHIVIGADRFITVPKPLQRIAVQFDHDVETVTFDCPRYWDDLDMSKMVIYINYKLPDGTLDAYPAKNIKADGDIMHFDWTISRNLTQYKGTITFLVCIKKTDTDGVEVNHWNSELCTDMYVSEGMECQEQAQMEYSDLITQLLERMTVVEGINVQAEEMQTLHDETLEAAALAKDESNYIKNSYANAYKQSVSGEVIRVDDVSPLEHIVEIKLSSKNLINLNDFQLGKSFLGAGEGSDIYTSDRADSATNTYVPIEPITTYTFSLDNTIYWLDRICEMDENDICVKNHAFYTGLYPNADSGGDLSEFTWTTSPKATYLVVRLINKNGDAVTLEDLQGINLQIENGDAVTDYYCFDPSAVILTRCGKNIIPYPYADNTITRAGVTYSAKPNGVIIASGVSSGSYFNVVTTASKRLYFKAGVVYHLSGVPKKTGLYYAYAKDASGTNYFDYGEGCSFIPKVSGYGAVTIVITTDSNISNIPFRPQIEIGSITDFELYDGETYSCNLDGTVDEILSLSPSMTLFTDTDGIIIDLTYNRDNNKVIGDISTALDTLLAMQENTIDLLDSMSGGTS